MGLWLDGNIAYNAILDSKLCQLCVSMGLWLKVLKYVFLSAVGSVLWLLASQSFIKWSEADSPNGWLLWVCWFWHILADLSKGVLNHSQSIIRQLLWEWVIPNVTVPFSWCFLGSSFATKIALCNKDRSTVWKAKVLTENMRNLGVFKTPGLASPLPLSIFHCSPWWHTSMGLVGEMDLVSKGVWQSLVGLDLQDQSLRNFWRL